MSNDLEAEIREALRSRAMVVTADDLGRGDQAAQPGRRPILAILATAAVVAALAIGIGVAAWPSPDDNRQPSATAGANLTGISWQFVKGIQETTNFTSPNQRVRIVFSRNGHYAGYDGVNYISGRYRLTSTGLDLFAGTTTLIGYAGHDRNAIATQTAFASLMNGRSTVTAHFNEEEELVLSGPGYMLWFRNGGAAKDNRDN